MHATPPPADFILFRSRGAFVCYKPTNLHSVGENSLATKLAALFPQLADLPDSGLVQRLDYETEGVIVGAWERQTQQLLEAQLKAGRFAKSYLVLVEGEFKQKREISGFIGSRYRGSKKVSWYDRPGSRRLAAATTLLPLGFFPHLNLSLVRAESALARRHQVRISCSVAGAPLVGDTLYGSSRILAGLVPELSERKFILIAERVVFREPDSDREIQVQAPFGETELRGLLS